MHIVALGWMFVVVLMVAAEATSTQGSLLGALITLLLYGLLPLGIVLYLLGTPARRRARRRQEAADDLAAGVSAGVATGVAADVAADLATTGASSAAAEAPVDVAGQPPRSAAQGNGGSHPAGLAIPAERKEP
jgi:membrane protein implicated in regulation of membrane protease activity